jgi:Cu2+-exporting ATPase
VEIRETPGGGVAGTVGRRTVVVGAPAFVASRAGSPGDALGAAVTGMVGDGLTPVLVAVDGRVVAAAGLGDPLRDDAAAALARLRSRGWRPGILSGDDSAIVAAVGRRLGLAPAVCRGRVSPETKASIVAEGTARGPVVMAGDGVNDAAALAAATVGVAVHGGAEAALAAGDVFVTRPGVARLADLVDGAHRTMAVVRRNLVFSLLYNVVGVALAMAGMLNPLIAAVLMPLSSLTVIASSYRARTFARAGAEDARWK